MSADVKPGYKQTDVGVIPEEWDCTTVRGLASLLAGAIGKSLSAVERAAARLVKAGSLSYIGPQKGGPWEVRR